jgi:hypothetical protein
VEFHHDILPLQALEVYESQGISSNLDPPRADPVWGQGSPRPMSEAEQAERIRLLQPLLAR